MVTIQHKFLSHKINPHTETLIIGTFNPFSSNNKAEFFYGRERNFLWRLLPKAFGDNDLKAHSIQEKIDFIKKRKIDFIDLISEINVAEGEENNYDDSYIDDKVISWRNIKLEIDKLSNLKKVCFTRKTFSGIPKMKIKIEEIQTYCESKNIRFQFLITPARNYTSRKQIIWTNFFGNDN